MCAAPSFATRALHGERCASRAATTTPCRFDLANAGWPSGQLHARLSRKQRDRGAIDLRDQAHQSFTNWLDQQTLEVLPESPIGKAVTYARNQRIALARFLEDGRLRLDNNKSERELRREAVGRKNWLFVGSDDGAKWNATFVSLIASCQQHKLEPWAYLRDILCLLPDWPTSRLLELAPKYWRETSQKPGTQQRLAANKLRAISVIAPHIGEATAC